MTAPACLIASMFGKRLPVVSVYTDSAYSIADASAFTFSNKSIGAAAGDRCIVVAVGNWQSAARPIASVTIAGNAMSQLVQLSAVGTNPATAGLFIYRLPAGTTADIVVTLSGGTAQGCVIGVWALYNVENIVANNTAAAYQAGTPYNVSTSINCPVDGAIVAFAQFVTASSPSTVSWTGMTEDFDIQGGVANSECSGASDEQNASVSNKSITATPSVGTFTGTLVAVSLR